MPRKHLIFGNPDHGVKSLSGTNGTGVSAKTGLQALRQQYAKKIEKLPSESTTSRDNDEDGDALDEWDKVTQRTTEWQEHVQSAGKGVVKSQNDKFSKIGYPEVENWLDALAIDPQVSCLPADDPWKSVLHRDNVDASHGRGLSTVWFLSHESYDFNNDIHFRMLRTIYTSLSRNTVCGSIGSHWEVLGFQNTDPRMDLNRSGGVLNVFHMMYFHSFFPDIFKAIFDLSQSTIQEFPFACASINITQVVLLSLLEGRLMATCRESSTSILEAICQVYCASFYFFYMQWKNFRRTIIDFDKTRKEIRDQSPEELLATFDKGVKAERDRRDPNKFEFTDLQFGSARLDVGDEVAEGICEPRHGVPAAEPKLRKYLARNGEGQQEETTISDPTSSSPGLVEEEATGALPRVGGAMMAWGKGFAAKSVEVGTAVTKATGEFVEKQGFAELGTKVGHAKQQALGGLGAWASDIKAKIGVLGKEPSFSKDAEINCASASVLDDKTGGCSVVGVASAIGSSKPLPNGKITFAQDGSISFTPPECVTSTALAEPTMDGKIDVGTVGEVNAGIDTCTIHHSEECEGIEGGIDIDIDKEAALGQSSAPCDAQASKPSTVGNSIDVSVGDMTGASTSSSSSDDDSSDGEIEMNAVSLAPDAAAPSANPFPHPNNA